MDKPLKIVLTGPESSGKSTLGKKLAEYFNATYIPEYARIYLEKHGADYFYDDLELITQGHLDFQSSKFQSNSDLYFLDTDLINFKIWEQEVFGKVHPFVDKKIKEENSHCYLLLYPDIKWTPDPLRENPNNRLELFEKHENLIKSLNRPYYIIRGVGNSRTEMAIKAVEDLFKKQARKHNS